MSPLKKEYEWVGKYTCAVRQIPTKFSKFHPVPYAKVVATWRQMNIIKHLRENNGDRHGDKPSIT
jgi:hypothetical protein